MRPFRPTIAVLAVAAAASLLALAPALRAEPLFMPVERESSWVAPDRQVHFAGSLAMAASLRVEGRSTRDAIALAFSVGVAKEIYDATLKPRRLGRGASRKDLVADLLGAAAGALLVVALER